MLTHAPTRATEAAVLGTVAYMAPEQIRGMAVDERSDIFSFGVVLYEMLAGERPYLGEPVDCDLCRAIIKDDPPALPATVPPQLAVIIKRCLAKEPAHRYQRGSEMEAALEAVRSEVPLRFPIQNSYGEFCLVCCCELGDLAAGGCRYAAPC